MKLILCTLAVCLSVLAAVLTLKDAVRAEGKRIRAAIPKALTEPLAPSKEPDSIAQKLDAVNAQLSSLSRRLAQIEGASDRPSRTLLLEKSSDPLLAEVRSLAANVREISGALSKLEDAPNNLAELTSYIDRSFEHLEKRMVETATPEELLISVDWLVQKVDDIDRYFTPLYAFLGVVYDPEHEDLLKEYPSVDVRINEVTAELITLQKMVADIRKNMIVPVVIEPSRHPR